MHASKYVLTRILKYIWFQQIPKTYHFNNIFTFYLTLYLIFNFFQEILQSSNKLSFFNADFLIYNIFIFYTKTFIFLFCS